MIRLRLIRKEKLICPEYPWEGVHTYLYGSVIKLSTGYRMYYQSYLDGIGFFVCLAESEDGINWKKPLIKPLKEAVPYLYPTVEVEGKILDFYHSTKSLECMSNVVANYHIHSVLHNPEDEYPYKLFGYTQEGYCVAFSKDGINFIQYEANPVIPLLKFPNRKTKKVWYSDVAPVFYDRKRRLYKAMVKTYKMDAEGRTRRCVGLSTSKDFLNWTKPKTVWIPSQEEDKLAQKLGFNWADFYGLCPFNYKDYYLGLLWLFFIDYEFERGTHEGKIGLYLAYSKDSLHWQRLSDEPLIPLEDWHNGMITTANQPIIEGNRLKIYYSGANFTHGYGEYEKPFDEKKHRACIGLAEFEILED
ncbi:hypothetical protein Hydth_1338 [Hydrogenobacter thermophilus TK-6]|uniref:Glycosyl hydrolase family 32 N-terminal domain-containing protein n=1 Tax=Hydrogenobacter thermophilus (strain DSM 6534 / IAM 12695 / TK-6) TaxID=608538 RepID=D3DIZ6_HYDTT|nr:hypothetical protein [Hydrogenobacter thermophilus]ADO45723.1 hypothetical protein Hydth_1338 [Hydrogenobacter thermophilus TK-6]BAI69798.1 hypothetical protein HTH_1347 [Hydrogenobacter thermophilus TK-6]